MFLHPSKTTLFQLTKPFPLGKYLFNQWLSVSRFCQSEHFSPYVVNLKPMYCETLLYFRKAYRNKAGYFKHSIIMQLCDFTFQMALESQSKIPSNRRPYKVELEILKETRSQISAICDLQDQAEKNKACLMVHDIDGDQIASAVFHLMT